MHWRSHACLHAGGPGRQPQRYGPGATSASPCHRLEGLVSRDGLAPVGDKGSDRLCQARHAHLDALGRVKGDAEADAAAQLRPAELGAGQEPNLVAVGSVRQERGALHPLRELDPDKVSSPDGGEGAPLRELLLQLRRELLRAGPELRLDGLEVLLLQPVVQRNLHDAGNDRVDAARGIQLAALGHAGEEGGVGLVPAHAKRGSEDLGEGAQRDDAALLRLVVRAERRGRLGGVGEAQELVDLVGKHHEAVLLGERHELLAPSGGHGVASGVVERGNRVHDARRLPGLAQGLEGVDIHALLVNAHLLDLEPQLLEDVEREEVARRLDNHRVARSREERAQEGQAARHPVGGEQPLWIHVALVVLGQKRGEGLAEHLVAGHNSVLQKGHVRLRELLGRRLADLVQGQHGRGGLADREVDHL
mmetsp:Transcript_11743/g.45794  ORF Transcript_11743/g.45794 Transcript_11743/m.45794 type:complete len:420 (-) Transcript_11743:70-1329(-)